MNNQDIAMYELMKSEEEKRMSKKYSYENGGRYMTIIQYYVGEEPMGDDYDVILYQGDDLDMALSYLEDVNEFDNYLDGATALYCSVQDYYLSYETILVDDIYIELK